MSNNKKKRKKRYSELTYEEYVTSSRFKNLINKYLKFMGVDGKIKIHIVDNTFNIPVACTTDCELWVNYENEISTSFPTRELKIQSLLGIIFHEIAHMLYTNFEKRYDFGQQLEKKGIWDCTVSNSDLLDEVKKWQDEYPLLNVVFGRIMANLTNVVEDIWIEGKLSQEYPGTVKDSIYMNRSRMLLISANAIRLQLDDPNTKKQTIFLNEALIYASCGKFFGNIPEKINDALQESKIFINKAINCGNAQNKLNFCTDIFLMLYKHVLKEEMEDIVEKLKDYKGDTETTEGSSSDIDIEDALANELLDSLDNVQSTSNDSTSDNNRNSSVYEGEKPEEEQQEQGGNNQSSEGEVANESMSVDGENNSQENTSDTTDTSDNADTSETSEASEVSENQVNNTNVENSTENNSKDNADNSSLERDSNNKGVGAVDEPVDKESSSNDNSLENNIQNALNKEFSEEELESCSTEEETQSVNEELQGDIDLDIISMLKEYAEKSEDITPRELNEELADIKFTNIHKGTHWTFVCDSSEITESQKFAYKNIYDGLKKQIKAFVRKEKKYISEAEEMYDQLIFGNELDTEHLYNKNGRIWRKKDERSAPSLAISLLIDESGSMNGAKIQYSKALAVFMEAVCRELKVPLSVTGHTSWGNEVVYDMFCDFEHKEKDKYRLVNLIDQGGNRDGAALLYTGERLLKRSERTKILIIMSDGLPASHNYEGKPAYEDLKAISKNLCKRGVKVIAAAIDEDKDVIKEVYGSNFLNVTDLTKMPALFAKILEKEIK